MHRILADLRDGPGRALGTTFAAALNDAYDRTIVDLTRSSRRSVTGGPISLNAGAALSAGFQETNGERLPIALVAVGLPTARARLRNVQGATFIERQRPVMIGNLAEPHARQAFERPLVDAGRLCDPEIVPIMLAAAGGHPYAIQLVGEYTWELAGDADVITVEHASRGADLARADLNTVYLERWEQLSDRQQQYLAAVVEHLDASGSAPSNLVAAAYGGTTRSAGQTRKALIEQHQLLYSDAVNSLRLALPGFDVWILRHHDRGDAPGLVATAAGSGTGQRAVRRAPRTRSAVRSIRSRSS